MNHTHFSHKKSSPHSAAQTNSKPPAWQRTKRAYRLTKAHLVLQVCDGHIWNALALAAITVLSSIPAETLPANHWLRFALPILLTTIGVGRRSIGQHAAAVERCDG